MVPAMGTGLLNDVALVRVNNRTKVDGRTVGSTSSSY